MTTGERIKYFRTHAGLSQRALALAIGTNQNQVFLWEADRFNPSLKFVRLLAKEFKCSMDDLLK